MEYISAKEAAMQWGITVRWVQQCCKNGQIPGATRMGRAWLIPKNAQKPNTSKGQASLYTPMPLTNGSFVVGECAAFIEAIPQEDERNLAWAEYFRFSGQAEQAVTYAEIYLDHQDPALRLSASLIYGFSSLTLGHIHAAHFAMTSIREILQEQKERNCSQENQAMCVFALVMGRVLLHLPPAEISLNDFLPYLPRGIQFYACYIVAHYYYLQGDYTRSLGVAETALALQAGRYPIPSIYLHLIASMDLMSRKQIEEAKIHFMKAWAIAQPDDLIQPFAEHHGLLHGLVEVCLKNEYPEVYARIAESASRFSSGWRRVHNPETHEEVTDDLTTTEFTIAMLANRGWTNKEIAAHMGFSANTIKSYISVIYQKLSISNRNQLKKYMLR